MTIPRIVKHIGSRARCQAESSSSPHSFLNLCSLFFPSPLPTHAHPRCSRSTCNLELHFLFSPPLLLCLSHAYICMYPKDQIPIWTELAAQPWDPLLPPFLLFSLFLLSAIQMKNILLSWQQWNLCSLRRALHHHLRVTDEIAFNRWLGR